MSSFHTKLFSLFAFASLALFMHQPTYAAEPAQSGSEFYATYPETTPQKGFSSEQVKRGEYLAKMGDCIACHTNVKQGEASYAGGLAIETPFGTFYSPNITPDKETGIGNWTEEDFTRALKEGKNPKGQHYFPVFPYVYFANITDEDAQDMYAYFMSIPAVKRENTSLPFPFNVPGARFSLLGWNLLFFYPNKPFEEDSSESAQWNRGKYIVDGLGHCSMCHTPLNPLGAPKTKYYLTGAFIDGYWAPNITKLGLETATDKEVRHVFSKNELINHAGPVRGPMADVNYDSLHYLTDEDLDAIITYLRTVESEEPLGLAPSDEPPSLARGRQVYLKACIICHQNGEMAAPRIGNGSNWTMRLKDGGLEALYKNAINGYNSMAPKGACVTCSNNDIKSAVDYILSESLSRSQWLDVKAEKLETSPKTGEAIYQKNCAVCHNTGHMNAPKLHDKEAWKPLAAKNVDVLVQHTLNSDHHPKQGACNKCSTEDVIEAIKYMLKESYPEGNYRLW